MIVITVQLVSANSPSRAEAKIIGRAVIANDGDTFDPKVGDYDAYVGRRDPRGFGPSIGAILSKPLRTGRVENYPRLSLNMWRLVIRSLLACFPEERK